MQSYRVFWETPGGSAYLHGIEIVKAENAHEAAEKSRDHVSARTFPSNPPFCIPREKIIITSVLEVDDDHRSTSASAYHDALANDDLDTASHIWHKRAQTKAAAKNATTQPACDHQVLNTQPDGIYCNHCGQRLIPIEEQEMRRMKTLTVPLLEETNAALRDQIRDLERRNVALEKRITVALNDLEAIATGMTGDYSPAAIANLVIAKLTTDK